MRAKRPRRIRRKRVLPDRKLCGLGSQYLIIKGGKRLGPGETLFGGSEGDTQTEGLMDPAV